MNTRLVNRPVEQIACAPQVRTRFDPTTLAVLAKSMREVGLLQPILVRITEAGPTVLDGQCRLMAARELKWPTIPAIVIDDQLGSADTTQRQLIANAVRADLSPIETALAIRQLMQETGWSAGETGEKLAMSPAAVSKHLSLLVLSDELRAAVHTDKVAASTAYEIAKTRDPKERERLTQEALAGSLTRDRAAKRSRTGRKPTKARMSGGRTPVARAKISLGNGRTVRVSGPDLSAATIVAWLEELVARLHSVQASPSDLADLAKCVSSEEA